MLNFINNKKIKPIFYIGLFVLLFLLVAFIYPLADDWVYLTAPNVNFNFKEALMPQESFWRPLDALFGGLMGKIPSLFPILNRALVVSAHILSAFFTGKILDELNFKTKSKVFSVLFFSFSSATISVIVSPDALNQSFCLLFGLIGLYLYLRKNNFYIWYLFWFRFSVKNQELPECFVWFSTGKLFLFLRYIWFWTFSTVRD